MKHSYREFIDELLRVYENDYYTVFSYLVRLKRGLKDTSKNYIFLKDIIYINGFIQIKHFVENGGNINELYFGKISLQDLSEIKTSEFIHFKVDEFKIPLFT